MIIKRRNKPVVTKRKSPINIDKQKMWTSYKKFAKRSNKNMFGD